MSDGAVEPYGDHFWIRYCNRLHVLKTQEPHWIYELSAPLSVFGNISGKKLSVYWTMNCANDMIEADPTFPAHVDEPPVWALLGLTLPAVFWCRRRSAKR